VQLRDNVQEASVVKGASERQGQRHGDNINTTQTLEYTKDKYNVKIMK
jgi:hypothetical protein